MDMSNAALPPIIPSVTERERAHPLFREYRAHQQSCIRLMIDCPRFADWIVGRQLKQRLDNEAKHPRFGEFQQWMRAHRGGARRCPAGDAFPDNFHYWLNGGRW